MTPAAASPVWADAALVAALFAIDPVGLGGVVVRSGPGPVRDRWLAMAGALMPDDAPVRRIPLGVQDDRLIGGLDLSASLAAGRPVVERGLLAEADGGVAILAMAERLDEAAAARLTAVLDSGAATIERDGLAARLPARLGVIALDEGLEPEERPPEALMDRLAFRLDLSAVGAREPPRAGYEVEAIRQARAGLAAVGPASDAMLEALCQSAEAMGLRAVRPPILALRAAQAHAALCGRVQIAVEDAAVAARLVLAPRALAVPVAPANDEPEPDDAERTEAAAQDGADASAQSEPPSAPADGPPDAERLVEAIRAALPDDLLARIALRPERPARAQRGRGAGASAPSGQRGRPVGSRPGALRPGDRLDLAATLRAATPWQKLRAGAPAADGADAPMILVRRHDFRIRRFEQRRESTTIFVVDASGSAAFQRLAEAKGAVELLLAKAYVSRARVALIAFRHTGAEVLLPPTRSLTRAKRALADLPGGGGTPLAAGLEAALALSLAEKAKDRTPLLVILTDGRANITLAGGPGRAEAEADAMAAARRVRAAGVGSAFVDTAPPAPAGRRPLRPGHERGLRPLALPGRRRHVGPGGQPSRPRTVMFSEVKPDWTVEGRDWPNREASRFVGAAGMRWHVQVMGAGPPLLLLHGAGAATHSWRELMPDLARDFTVYAPDLPGHGFTDTPGGDGLSLRGMAREVSGLLAALKVAPALTVGHSAGAAIALRMRLDGRLGESGLVSLNGALQPFPGAAGHLFPAMAKLLFLNPVAIQTFVWRAGRPGAVRRLIESTGSKIDERGLRCYEALMRTSGHIAGALGMMARWDLQGLQADLPTLAAPLTLIAAENDRAVPPAVAGAVQALVPTAALVPLPKLGHLAHEEAPGLVADLIRQAAAG